MKTAAVAATATTPEKTALKKKLLTQITSWRKSDQRPKTKDLVMPKSSLDQKRQRQNNTNDRH